MTTFCRLVLKPQKDRKVIETLLEKHRIKRQKEELRREQKLLDEFSVASYSRRRAAEKAMLGDDDYDDSYGYGGSSPFEYDI